MSNSQLIDKLYSFMHNEPPLNPILASYFAKCIGSLINTQGELIVTYLQSKCDFVPLLLRHINTSAIMDILMRLLTTIENVELKKRVFTWLIDCELIKNLIGLFSREFTDDVHANVSQSLCDIIRVSREQIFSILDATIYNPSSSEYNKSSAEFLASQPPDAPISPLLNAIES